MTGRALSGYGYRSWFEVEPDLFVCVPAKCGKTAFRMAVMPDSTSMRDFRERMSREGRGPWTPDEIAYIRTPVEKLLAVRDPVTRFRSLWRDAFRPPQPRKTKAILCREGRHTQVALEDSERGADPLAALAYIESFPNGNPHWFPQHGYLAPGTKLVRFDHLLRRIGLPLQGPPPNKSVPVPGEPEMPRLAITRVFARDAAMWASVQHQRPPE